MGTVLHDLGATPHARLQGLRVNDLISKVARVTMKDTIRVLMALDAVVDFLEVDADTILGFEFSHDRPTAQESAKCTEAFEALQAYLVREGDGGFLEELRKVD